MFAWPGLVSPHLGKACAHRPSPLSQHINTGLPLSIVTLHHGLGLVWITHWVTQVVNSHYDSLYSRQYMALKAPLFSLEKVSLFGRRLYMTGEGAFQGRIRRRNSKAAFEAE